MDFLNAAPIPIAPLFIQLPSATATPLLVDQLCAYFLTRSRGPASAHFHARTPTPHTTRSTPGARFLLHLRYLLQRREGSQPPRHTHAHTLTRTLLIVALLSQACWCRSAARASR